MRFIPASEATREVYECIAREEGMEEGIGKGIETGRQEGKQEGRLEGKLEGRLEGVRTVMEALMKMGLPADQVAREIGLSDEKFHDLMSER
jgi:predicted transposase YdaD